MAKKSLAEPLWKKPKLCPFKKGSKKERECDYELCGFWWEGAYEVDKECAVHVIAENLADIAWYSTPKSERGRIIKVHETGKDTGRK